MKYHPHTTPLKVYLKDDLLVVLNGHKDLYQVSMSQLLNSALKIALENHEEAILVDAKAVSHRDQRGRKRRFPTITRQDHETS